MKREKLTLALILLLLGFIGVLSLLTSAFSTENLPPEVLAMFSPEQLRYLSLVNPAVLTLLAVIIGSLLLEKSGLRLPFLESLVRGKAEWSLLPQQLKWGIPLGLLTGTFMFFFAAWFERMLPDEFAMLASDFKPSICMKLLYGGITEEIMLRFGLMTATVCLFRLIFKNHNPTVYWISILLTAFLFGAGHLGVVFRTFDIPSTGMISYVVLGNSIGGIVLGWLYWKKGLESSIFGHISMHLAMIFFLAVSG